MSKTSLKDYLTPDQPFGPISASEIEDNDVFDELFDRKNLIYSEIKSRPTVIIGRRGAGKTAFLRSVVLNPRYKIIIEMPAYEGFRQIVNTIEGFSKGIVFPEEISNLWNTLFWIAIFIRLNDLKDDAQELSIVKKYVSGIGIQKKMSPYTVIKDMLMILKERSSNGTVPITADFINSIDFNEISFLQAKQNAINFLESRNMRLIILLDSLEDFRLEAQTMSHAISGLLRCQATFYSAGSPCELRCCIPSELFHVIMDLSSNPNIDFRNQLLIHWHAEELIRIAAHRYAKYLELHTSVSITNLRHLDLDTRSGAIKFWASILPASITNRLGEVEDPLPYILRHTQLLPRHFLMYMNSISIKNQGKGDHLKFTSQAILSGIHEVEERICSEIFIAFKYVYPGAKEACKRCIPYLPLRFTDGELHTVYIRHGKGISGVNEYEDLKRILIEIGSVGKVINITDSYISGLFEYTVPHKLITSSDNELCLHPVFSEVFSAIKPQSGNNKQVVYPYGCNIDDEEYREFNLA